MRQIIIDYLRVHPKVLGIFWRIARVLLSFIGFFIPIRQKTMLITSFAGRKYDDSPRALYEEILKRREFDDWDIIWAFVDPDKFDIPKGRKMKIDSWKFFMALLYSRVWISNSGMDRNIGINKKGTIKIETWHGTPIKKIGSDQNSGTLGNHKEHGPLDRNTIRCAQSKFDRNIFARVFNADKKCILLSDLPRNDGLLKYEDKDVKAIKEKIGLDDNKKVLLYMPTYREYLVNEKNQTYLAPPIDLVKWEKELGNNFILLIRAHYAISTSLNISVNGFVKDVSEYPYINDLYAVADILISDYSSAYIDFSILDKPMLCFAYDEEEYNMKRGLYIDLRKELPCTIDNNEDTLIDHIKRMDWEKESEASRHFHRKYAPYAGNASSIIIDRLQKKLQKKKCNV